MKSILLLLLTTTILKASNQETIHQDTIPKLDTIYPIKIELNRNELICFSCKQGQAIYANYQLLKNCQKTVEGKDSLIASINLENSKLVQIAENEKSISEMQKRKADLYFGIIEEKDKQLNLSKREGVVNTLANKGNIINTAIFAFLSGCLVGYLVHK